MFFCSAGGFFRFSDKGQLVPKKTLTASFATLLL
jgi:hypothetical protein